MKEILWNERGTTPAFRPWHNRPNARLGQGANPSATVNSTDSAFTATPQGWRSRTSSGFDNPNHFIWWITRASFFTQDLVATAVGVATLTSRTTFFVTMTATAVATATLVKQMFVTLTATAVGVATLTKQMFVTLAATAIGIAALVTALSFQVALAATAVGLAVFRMVTTFFQTLAATAIGIVTLATEFIAGGTGTPPSFDWITRWRPGRRNRRR